VRKYLTARDTFGHHESQSQSCWPLWGCKQRIDVHYCNFCLSMLHHLCQVAQMTTHKLSSQLKHRRCAPCSSSPRTRKRPVLYLSQTLCCPFLPRGHKKCKSLISLRLRHRFLVHSHIASSTHGHADVEKTQNGHLNDRHLPPRPCILNSALNSGPLCGEGLQGSQCAAKIEPFLGANPAWCRRALIGCRGWIPF
jgi:hypothetical protein